MLTFTTLCQSRNHLPQRQQTLVDVDRLFRRDIAGLALPLTTSEVNELKGADDRVVGLLGVDTLDGDFEEGVGSTAGVVHIVRGDDLVLDAEVVEGEDVFGASTLKGVQVLHLEVILDPLQFQPRPIRHQSLQV